jgi:protein SCO1
MKHVVNIICILGIGVVAGLMIRQSRSATIPDDVIVFTNDSVEFTPSGDAIVDTRTPIENPEPTRPPEGEAWLSRFELTERNGETVSSDGLKGTPYIVSFFFTMCPSICVQQNQKLKELQDQFAGREVKFIAISVDPETDTPERLREYATRFGADSKQWLFLTGDLTYIRRIGAEIFQQPVDKQFHTERFALVDREGKIEGFYAWPERKQMARLVEKIESMTSAVNSMVKPEMSPAKPVKEGE